MYRILYEKIVFKDLAKIPDTDVSRIRDALKELLNNPVPTGCKKLAGRAGLYRLRQGNYRIIYAVDFKGKEIRVILIGHRKEIYRQL
ncbi:MAG: type II toxin-antitoxin system RelE/ParE family toxin [Elusimicrobia bacterium]|nr:type II toxin-antitoxin system RelE/ParE family toxin [Elusimicrobiota bacterium]